MNNPQISKMIQFVASCDDPSKLRSIARNAEARGATELWRAAKLRLYAVLPSEQPGTLEFEVWQSIHALEDTLSDERGRTTRLSRTRQKIGRQGEADCVADLILGQAAEGFKMLRDRAMLELSFEAIALRFPDRFSPAVLAAAKARLIEAGFDLQR